MSYAICDVIYGLPLTDEASELVQEVERDAPECQGITFVYTQGGPPWGYVGVKLGEFDETVCPRFDKDNVTLRLPKGSCPLYATHQQEDEAKAKIDGLHPELRRRMPGEPSVFFVFSSS